MSGVEASARPSSKLIDSTLRVGLLALLVFACGIIVKPFVGILLWSAILAVMLYPLQVMLAGKIGNRWAALLLGVVSIALVLVPLGYAMMALARSVLSVIEHIRNNTLVVPPPPARLASLPLIGGKLTAAWTSMASDLPATLAKNGPQLRALLSRAGGFAAGLSTGILSFALSLGIAAVLVAYGAACRDFMTAVFVRLTGNAERGQHLVTMTAATIRGVGQGVVGVAALQSAILGLGFFVAGIPFAGLLTLIVLLVGIVQIPAIIVVAPIIAYAFTALPPATAGIFAVWSLVGGLSDNVLKPLLLGRGLEVPMPVILIGVLGGLVSGGLVGVFTGPVVLAVGYVLFIDWLHQPNGAVDV
jgi:predicted PurR-regulated permease PerM